MQIECLSSRPYEINEIVKQLAIRNIGNVVDYCLSSGLNVGVIGSIGRSLSASSDLPEMQKKYNSEAYYRDIDLVVVGQEKDKKQSFKLLEKVQKIAYPFPVEISKYIKSDGEQTSISYRQLKYEISTEVFKTRNVNLEGRNIPIFDPNTLFHLSALYLKLRPKDFKNLLDYNRIVRNKENILPENLFEPFHRIIQEKYKLYPLDNYIAKLRDFYVENCPIPIRKCISPFLDEVKNNYVSRI
jgi:hypothetical protein